MALVKAETFHGFSRLPVVRQLGLMIGLAASVAAGVAIVLWSQTPNYSILFGNLDNKETSRVLESLQKAHINYKLDAATGLLMVPVADVQKARIHLAKEGLPETAGTGLEFLQKEESLKTSKFTQYRRYIHAQEIELARTISSMQGIESARVHLAISEPNAFIRDKPKAKATVFIKLYSGRELDYDQAKAIVHMVSSSISDLEASNISVIDQNGKLLSSRSQNSGAAMTDSQFEHKNRMELDYTRKIEDLVSPFVGDGRVRAKVDIDLDLTQTEQTRESYNPDLPAIKSERVEESKRPCVTTPSGIPGALSNQPPVAGTTNPTGANQNKSAATAESSHKIVDRTYKHDKSYSVIKSPAGKIRRMSVAVLVDDKRGVDEDGESTKTPLSKAEIEQITGLIQEAIGFEQRRGDSIKVSNTSFYTPPPLQPLPEVPFMERPWVWAAAKQGVGLVAVLIIFFGVLKPIMKSLAERGATMVQGQRIASGEGGETGAFPAQAPTDRQLEHSKYDDKLTFAKNMVGQDPGRVAQVVKNWVADDG